MKRIYRMSKSKKLREEMLAQLDKTRAQFEKEYPDLLKKARIAIFAEDYKTTLSQEKLDEEVIDRKKTIEVILKYASSQTGAKKEKLKKELMKFLN